MSYTQYSSLSNKVVFITGGATGIGAAMVKAFAAQGCLVYFVDCNESASVNLCAEYKDRDVIFQCCDVSKPEELKACLDNVVTQYKRVDILINSAANDQRYELQDMSLDEWGSSLAINLTPMFVASQKVAPIMAESGGGVIINFSSINALFGPSQLVAYNTAKAGVIGMTKSLARELGGDGIRVNAVIPGWVATEKQLNSWLTPEAEAEWTARMCLKDRITPNAVARLVLFLASDDSSMITSQQFVVDGGWM